MHVSAAALADVNICYHLDKSYVTDYVWQMQTRESGRTLDIRFDTIRLPRPMRVVYPRSADELIEHWQRDECFLVARNLEDEIVGFLDARLHEWQNLLWVSNLAVQPQYRRQGFGSRLLKVAIDWALARNLCRIMLEVQTKNYPAICFAQKHGFQFCGYNERYYKNGDIALFFSLTV
ncbi:MAG: GNAT family N-acetyltransferase [Chloroflexota bacterium]